MYLNRISKNIHLTVSLTSVTILFILGNFQPVNNLLFLSLLQDIVSIALIFSLSIKIKDYIRINKISFLNLTFMMAVILGIFLMTIWISPMFMDDLIEKIKRETSLFSFASNIAGIIYYSTFVLGVTFIFVVLKEFYFSKRIKYNPIYFQLLIAFALLSALSLTLLSEVNPAVSTAFMVVTILLIIRNSFGISWIAFLNKKEKFKLLFTSLAIAILASVLVGYSAYQSLHTETLRTYSSGFNRLSLLILIYALVYFGVLFFTVLFHLPTAEAFDRKAEEVSSLQLFSTLINQVIDIDDLADTITDLTRKVSSADASWIVTNNGNNFETISQKNISEKDLNEINNYLLSKNECNNLTKAKIFSLLDKSYIKLKLSEHINSVIISPLRTQTEIKGYLLAARKNGLLFYDDEAKAINAFSEYASIALENSRLLKQSIEKERLQKELDVAREMQRKLLPAINPNFSELEICSIFIPAFEVGGDFYDYYTENSNEFSFIIGDVAGKGISAAFVMAEVKGIFESLSRILISPKEILIRANRILSRTLHRKNFVSALYGKINFNNSEFEFARAGHCPVLLIRDGEIAKCQISTKGIGFGFRLYRKLCRIFR